MRVSGRVSLLRRGRLLGVLSLRNDLVHELGQTEKREHVRSQLRVVPAEVLRLGARALECGRVFGREVDVLAGVDVRTADPARLVRVQELGDEHHHRPSGNVIAFARLAQEDRPTSELLPFLELTFDLSVLVQLRQEQQKLFSGHVRLLQG